MRNKIIWFIYKIFFIKRKIVIFLRELVEETENSFEIITMGSLKIKLIKDLRKFAGISKQKEIKNDYYMNMGLKESKEYIDLYFKK